MGAIIEDLVALRLDQRRVCKSDPLHMLVVAAEAVTDMEASRSREAVNILRGIPCVALDSQYRVARDAVSVWAEGDLFDARQMLDMGLASLEGDAALLAGYLAHMASFYLGDEKGMLDTSNLLAGLYPTMSRRAVGLSDGLASFALEECGRFSEAIETADRALTVNRDDVYALHAKVHALQCVHENRAARALISSYANGWSTAEPMRIHMWWHFALTLIKEREWSKILLCYDLELRRKRRVRAWEDLDAVALLWRLEMLGGEDLSKLLAPRWRMLAQAWECYTAEPNYIWNDLHAVMTFVKVENHHLFAKVVNACKDREAPGFFHSVCEPLFWGLAAFAQRDYATTVRLLGPVLRLPQLRIGGSKVQQSVFHWTRDAADAFLRDADPHEFLDTHTHTHTRDLAKEA